MHVWYFSRDPLNALITTYPLQNQGRPFLRLRLHPLLFSRGAHIRDSTLRDVETYKTPLLLLLPQCYYKFYLLLPPSLFIPRSTLLAAAEYFLCSCAKLSCTQNSRRHVRAYSKSSSLLFCHLCTGRKTYIIQKIKSINSIYAYKLYTAQNCTIYTRKLEMRKLFYQVWTINWRAKW